MARPLTPKRRKIVVLCAAGTSVASCVSLLARQGGAFSHATVYGMLGGAVVGCMIVVATKALAHRP